MGDWSVAKPHPRFQVVEPPRNCQGRPSQWRSVSVASRARGVPASHRSPGTAASEASCSPLARPPDYF